ncbi:GAF and ANTAR domain-containing protein [Arthrobacter sp. ISL-95]|uniref:GAF and ANTAR domain-containing protein n=1 Tax=Arthrobacter sp. ISL-95 TaxID=2819116 RepID=UPI002852EDD5|nr:GAF and ANTAR domain-containing protein [Arthrobacter sp. ISL-95]
MAQQNLLPASFVVDRMQDLVLESQDVKEMLDELADFSSATLTDPALAFCSITLMRRKKPVTVASSEERALRLDQAQYSSGLGPCLGAIRAQVVVHAPDLANDDRWPSFASAAVHEGVRSSLSVPLALAGEGEASLNLYSTRVRGFTEVDIDSVQAYTYHAAKAVRLRVRLSQLAETKKNLLATLESRTTIDLAAGAIMAQNRCSQETAMKILQVASSTRNVKLRDVAATVVAALTKNPEVRTYFDE